MRRRHAVEDNTQSGEPIGRSSHVRHQSLSAALDDRQHNNTIDPIVPSTTTTTTCSPDSQSVDIWRYNTLYDTADLTATTTDPSLATISTTSSPDRQSIDNKRHYNSDSDIELIGRVPAPKRPARNRSPVDIKPSLIDSIPVPEIVNKPPVETITITKGGNELIHELAPGIRRVRLRTPSPPPPATHYEWSSGTLVHRYSRRCDYCVEWFDTTDDYLSHTRAVHGTGQPLKGRTITKPGTGQKCRTVPCDDCGRYFYNEFGLSQHKKAKHLN
ncbi:unnamed protein product [Medioppia subpectinata]|uniref:C2H2-type domain-containing protein n=1 Tax=Medioppia subpectinata TaxID=1979941 RepID=A0A7R9LEA3_9ACAR|nr:unnamed protein product [Medioppia subpectinata]CAG2118082.1 unnamed protein product [Medioppia subpectinata]